MQLPGRHRHISAVARPGRARPGRNALRVYSRPEREALTAAGFRIRRREADLIRRLIQPWQGRSFTYYDAIGEIKYAAQFYSRAMSSLGLYIAEEDAAGELAPTKDEGVNAYLDRVQDPGGGRSGLLSTYGRLMFLVGEAQLFVSKNEDTDAEQWEMLSTDELRVTSDGYMRYKAPSMPAEDFKPADEDDYEPINDDTAVAYRLWRRHPRYSMLADSTMQGILDLCEELMLLTLAVRARARSRLAGAGILLVPEEISPKPAEPVGDEDALEDPFLDDLVEAMTTPLNDEGSAESVVPLVIRGKAEHLEKLRHLQVVDPTQLYPETGLRRECIERIAIGLDLPPEILLGLADSNHWTAWLIDEQTWKAHLQPLAQQFCDDLTSSYLRPSLKADGVADWDKYQIAYDATKIINHPDRAKDAKELWDREALSDAALREATGFDEADKITDEDELNRRLGVKIRDASLAVYGIPSVRGGIEPAAGELEGTSGTSEDAVKAPPAGTPSESPASDEPLPESVLGSSNGHSNGMSALAARVLGASDLALLRAREAAGARVRNLAKKDREAFAAIDGTPAGRVCHVLGPEAVRRLGAGNELELVRAARAIVLDAFRVYRLPDDVVERLATLIEQHAARTLYEERPLPLPAAYTNYVSGLA